MIREPLPVVPQGNTVWRESVPLPERLFLPLSGVAMHGKSAGHLAQLLHPSRLVSDPRKAQAVLAWGRKPSAERAQRVAAMHRLPLWRMEDAFLRSIRPGPAEQPLGVVFDDLGIYYDAACGSRLEWLINRPLDDSAEARAVNLIRLWREHGVSKYNHAREYGEDLPEDYVLVIDQTRGDLSTRHGAADESVFRRMLEAALEENPGDSLLLKVHPEVVAGRKKGHFDFRSLSRDRRIRLVIEDAHLVRLVKGAKKIYTVTSQAGFEGLLWGKIVRTFGMPFYAGWGLTEDDLARPARRTRCSLQQLAHAALVDYARYADPESGRRCGVEEIVEYLGTQRRLLGRYPAHLAAPGFPLAKRAAVRRFFCYSRVTFGRNPARAKGTDALLVWGRQTGRRDLREIPTIHLEDGFIRSIGLGSAFAPAASWVADRAGIYFDPTRPSDLENILQNDTFAPEVLARARSLISAIVGAGLTKYNTGTAAWTRPAGVGHVILVPGQVENDASVTWGSPKIRSNAELLKAVRAGNPDAYLVYKAHPDVVARSRCGGTGAWGKLADAVADDSTSIVSLFDAVDEIHTMTSLAGFEALLRGKPVTTHGMPFYAGWGLTNDLLPAPARRTRRLRLEELVAGSLILYPLYVSATTGRPTTPERVVQQIAEGAALKASGAMEALFAGLNPAGAFCRRVAGRLFFSLASHRSI